MHSSYLEFGTSGLIRCGMLMWAQFWKCVMGLDLNGWPGGQPRDWSECSDWWVMEGILPLLLPGRLGGGYPADPTCCGWLWQRRSGPRTWRPCSEELCPSRFDPSIAFTEFNTQKGYECKLGWKSSDLIQKCKKSPRILSHFPVQISKHSTTNQDTFTEWLKVRMTKW